MRINKRISFGFKLFVLVGSFAFVFLNLYKQDNSSIAESVDFELLSQTWPFLIVAVSLMLVGWSIEAFKWIFALKGIVDVSFLNAIKTVWYGVGVGLITPNRIGEPIGRIAMIKTEFRANAGVMAVLCSISQQLATLFFGLVGGVILFVNYDFGMLENYWNSLTIIFLSLSALVPVLVFFNVNWFTRIINRFSLFQRLLLNEKFDTDIAKSKLFVILGFSLLRYAVFSTQFVLLLLFFGFYLGITEAYLGVFLTYLFASTIPTFALAEVGVRSSLAILFVGAFWFNPAGITLAASLLWIVNIALPGLIGVWIPFVTNKRTDKKNSSQRANFLIN